MGYTWFGNASSGSVTTNFSVSSPEWDVCCALLCLQFQELLLCIKTCLSPSPTPTYFPVFNKVLTRDPGMLSPFLFGEPSLSIDKRKRILFAKHTKGVKICPLYRRLLAAFIERTEVFITTNLFDHVSFLLVQGLDNMSPLDPMLRSLRRHGWGKRNPSQMACGLLGGNRWVKWTSERFVKAPTPTCVSVSQRPLLGFAGLPTLCEDHTKVQPY